MLDLFSSATEKSSEKRPCYFTQRLLSQDERPGALNQLTLSSSELLDLLFLPTAI